jgi:tape measure domain-containing protein
MAATEIANAYIALYTKMPGVQGDITKALGGVDATKAGEGVGSKFSAGIAGIVGGAMAAVTTKAIGVISSSIDAAIARVDTMTNFPKIMQNLGYSSDEAAASIQTMSQRLTGLPTALDSMAGMVQQLAPLAGGLSEATELSLALNNALLAGGKSTDIQANAMEQYTQMLAIGKVDMAAWRSMVSAMPGQMDQLAASLLGAGNKSMDLYEAMKEGTIGFDEFNAAVLRLNSEGTGEFASFETQARSATEGIGTGIANLNTAITRNLANVIQKMEPAITGFVAGLTAVTNAIGPLIAGVVDFAMNSDLLVPVLAGLGAVILTALAPSIWAAVTATWAWTAALLANPLTWIALAIGAVVGALVWFFTQTELGKEIWENFTKAIATVTTWLWETVLKPTFDMIGAVFTWLWENVLQHVVAVAVAQVEVLGQIFTWLYENAIKPSIDAIGVIFTWLWENVIQYIVAATKVQVEVLGAVFTWLYENAIRPALEAAGVIFTWLWENVINPILSTMGPQMEAVGQIFTWLYENAIKPAFEQVSAAFTWIWNSIVQPVSNFIISSITTVGDTIRAVFGGISDFIGAAFQGAVNAAKWPINALIDMINGVIGSLNSISVDIPGWVPEYGGKTFSVSLPTIPRLAEGGIIRAQRGGILANIGEGRYDEAVIPLSPAVLSQIGGGVVQNNTFNEVNADPRFLLREAGRELKAAMA